MAETTKVRRVKAKPTKAKPAQPKKSAKKPRRKLSSPRWLRAIGRFFAPMGRYVAGAWAELKVTKWPNRRATWGLTVAVILFSLFFAALILSFDNLFNWLLELTLNLGGN